MKNREIAAYLTEGLLLGMEAGTTFRLTARCHAEPPLTKPMATVRLLDGSWESSWPALVAETIAQRDDLDEFLLRITSPSHTAWSGKTVHGKAVGLVRILPERGTAAIDEFLLGTGTHILARAHIAAERCREFVPESYQHATTENGEIE